MSNVCFFQSESVDVLYICITKTKHLYNVYSFLVSF